MHPFIPNYDLDIKRYVRVIDIIQSYRNEIPKTSSMVSYRNFNNLT